jgi:hypothetical protein
MKKLTPEEALAELCASAAYHVGRVKPRKPTLKLPEGCRDVTAEQAGKTFAIVGYPGSAGAARPIVGRGGRGRGRLAPSSKA